MARLWIQYPGVAPVRIDGEVRGETNRVLRLEPGDHRIELAGESTEPAFHRVSVAADADPDKIVSSSFRAVAQPIDRLASPLYCRYNGFMLGQFLLESYRKEASEEYPVRRARMQEFLDEIGVELAVPDWHPIQTPAPDEFDVELWPALSETSPEIARFARLAVGLMEWSFAQGDGERQAVARDLIDPVVEECELAAPDLARFEAREIDDQYLSADSILDWAGAERAFSDAIAFGNNATEIHFQRAWARIRLEEYARAEEDLTGALARADLDKLYGEETPWPRATAHFQRAFARQEPGDEAGAAADLAEAGRLGFPVDDALEKE